jgi:cyclopropane-fatty-acyl-phospholipid synthase
VGAKTKPEKISLTKIFSKSPLIDRICRKILLHKISTLKSGQLIIQETFSGGEKDLLSGDGQSSEKIRLQVHRSSFYTRTLFGGSIGNAESYVDQDWDSPDLVAMIQLFVKNRDVLEGLDNGFGKLLQPLHKLAHVLRSNTLKNSRKNISAHYDIGNDFFELFLDPTMMYSSAIFENPHQTLEEASLWKLDLICQKLKLNSSHHLIEIGTGWGALAIYAAQTFGCRVTTTTISTEQFSYAQEKIKQAGLEDRITLLFEDYRKLEGQYDRLVSVEMIEAVGPENLPEYFQKCSSLLKPEGRMVIQSITIRDEYYEAAKNSVDFIQRHIFPGGGLPSMQEISTRIKKNTDLKILEEQDYALDYANTLKQWSQSLNQNKAELARRGYPEELYRLWHFYFAYCEGGFREKAIGLSQIVFVKPKH